MNNGSLKLVINCSEKANSFITLKTSLNDTTFAVNFQLPRL